MHKTKAVFVAMLSLLLVLAPVSSVLATTKPASSLPEKKSNSKTTKANVFEEIENNGGNEVSDEKLAKEKGEFWGTVAWTGIGAAAGAASYGIEVAMTGRSFSWGGLGTRMVANAASAVTGYGIGAAAAGAGSAVSHAAAAAGTIIGDAVGSAISSISPWN